MTTNFGFLIIWTVVSWVTAYSVIRRFTRVSARLSPDDVTQRRLNNKEMLDLDILVRALRRDNNRLQRDNARLEQELRRIER